MVATLCLYIAQNFSAMSVLGDLISASVMFLTLLCFTGGGLFIIELFKGHVFHQSASSLPGSKLSLPSIPKLLKLDRTEVQQQLAEEPVSINL